MKDLSKYGALEEGGQQSSYDQPEAGGYVCKITVVTDASEKEYLYLELDIAEGKFANYYKDLQDRYGFWGLHNYASYKDNDFVISKFKQMCSAFNHSNPGKTFNPFDKSMNHDEKILLSGVIGACLGEEEYKKNDGTTGTRLAVRYFCNAKKVRDGKIKAPKKKVLEDTGKGAPSVDAFVNVSASAEEEIPFN